MKGGPVDSFKPRMTFDLFGPVIRDAFEAVYHSGDIEEAAALSLDDRVGAARLSRSESVFFFANKRQDQVLGLSRDTRLRREAKRLTPIEDLHRNSFRIESGDIENEPKSHFLTSLLS